ncbi:MAG: ATP-grasp domain-containing protein [Candidatus Eremiobacterota bacterium]
MSEQPVTFLCFASFYKGTAFIEECKALGCRTILLTDQKLKDKDWPWSCIDERFFMNDLYKQPDITRAVSYLARDREIDRIVPLDDFDVEVVASLREHLRSPGMGDTTARFFRDKLAMRVQARDEGITVPDFVHVLNHKHIEAFTHRVHPPWVLKPRSQAGAVGIKKLHSPEELWRKVHELGDEQSNHLLEQYVAGDVYHVDSIVYDHKVLFQIASRYGTPPFNVWNEGGVFLSQTVNPRSAVHRDLLALNEKLLKAMRLVRGVTHAEFIKGHDGHLYFLELAARVGGANIDRLVEEASGFNLWREWARLEHAYCLKRPYRLTRPRNLHAGLLICLSKAERPDLSSFDAPEVAWRYAQEHHAGIVVAGKDHDRVSELLGHYKHRLEKEVLAVAPPTDKAIH